MFDDKNYEEIDQLYMERMANDLLEAEERVKELEAWYNGTWMKGVPDVGLVVLIKHELGCGENHDVACYMGKDKKGDDIFMMSNGTEIIRGNVIRWRMI